MTTSQTCTANGCNQPRTHLVEVTRGRRMPSAWIRRCINHIPSTAITVVNDEPPTVTENLLARVTELGAHATFHTLAEHVALQADLAEHIRRLTKEQTP